MLNEAAVVLTLKRTTPPLFTLMSVANPWIVPSPAPMMSHSLAGLPASRFSHRMGLAAPSHDCACAVDAEPRNP